MRKAPWTDFAGNDIYEGDTIRHPTGDTGTVIFSEEKEKQCIDYGWRVDYEGGDTLWLGNQIGDKGRAVVVKCERDSQDSGAILQIPNNNNQVQP